MNIEVRGSGALSIDEDDLARGLRQLSAVEARDFARRLGKELLDEDELDLMEEIIAGLQDAMEAMDLKTAFDANG